ncbi:hypothetical protein [Streptomyces sp. NPDC056401]|uniref:hypothetical protein n=1 Tax=Streptomyces sp. NPDC056401 TaxID=3345809 RepID=UPI0035D717E3
MVTGWRRHVAAGLDALSARRRPLADRLGLHGELLELASERPRQLGELTGATSLPASLARMPSISYGTGA